MSKQPAAKTDAAPAVPHDTAKFIAAQGTDQWVFSKFKGTDVLGPDNAHIGNVSDMLFDKNGKIFGLIVGVGGFLGIGEKSVAIDMSAFQAVPASTGSTVGAGGAAGAGRALDPSLVPVFVNLLPSLIDLVAPDEPRRALAEPASRAGLGSTSAGLVPASSANAFANIALGDAAILLSGPGASGSRPMPNGQQQTPGGWNRVVLRVTDLPAFVETLKSADVHFRNEMETGPGGRQIQIEDPDGNPIELFEPAR